MRFGIVPLYQPDAAGGHSAHHGSAVGGAPDDEWATKADTRPLFERNGNVYRAAQGTAGRLWTDPLFSERRCLQRAAPCRFSQGRRKWAELPTKLECGHRQYITHQQSDFSRRPAGWSVARIRWKDHNGYHVHCGKYGKFCDQPLPPDRTVLRKNQILPRNSGAAWERYGGRRTDNNGERDQPGAADCVQTRWIHLSGGIAADSERCLAGNRENAESGHDRGKRLREIHTGKAAVPVLPGLLWWYSFQRNTGARNWSEIVLSAYRLYRTDDLSVQRYDPK